MIKIPKTYDKEFLIEELHRFVAENGRIPSAPEMSPKFGYPSHGAYEGHFGSWNNALKAVGFEINQISDILDGTETCAYCGKRADEILNFTHWRYPDGVRYCHKHGYSAYGKLPHYVTGNLDINSSSGLGRAGEILVIKTLEIGKEHDCNRISCGYSFDMYHDEYGRIDVKTSLLSNDIYNRWGFRFPDKEEIKTFICIGLSSDRSIVEHVWIVPNEGEIINKGSTSITDTVDSLLKNKKWEVDAKPYNDMWQTMKLKTCNSMTDKSKPKVKLTWEEAVKKAAEIRKEIEMRKLNKGD